MWIYLVEDVIEGWDSTNYIKPDNKPDRNGSRIETVTIKVYTEAIKAQ